MNVTRIQTEASSHIEPPCDDAWPDRVKLEWWAAVTAHDTGLRIEISDAEVSHGQKKLTGLYHITVGGSSAVPFTFREAWTYLNGVSTGAEQSRSLAERVQAS